MLCQEAKCEATFIKFKINQTWTPPRWFPLGDKWKAKFLFYPCNVYSFSSSFLPSLHKSTFAVLLPFGSYADLNRFFLKGKEQSLKFSYKVWKLQMWQLWYKTNKRAGVLSILKTGLTAFQKPGLEKVLSSTECLSIMYVSTNHSKTSAFSKSCMLMNKEIFQTLQDLEDVRLRALGVTCFCHYMPHLLAKEMFPTLGVLFIHSSMQGKVNRKSETYLTEYIWKKRKT